MPRDIITDAPKPPSPPDTTPQEPNSAIYSDPNAIRVYIVDEKTGHCQTSVEKLNG